MNFNKKDKVAIVTHRTPDPDAIGAAVGLKWLLNHKFDIDPIIVYAGEISHTQNKTMVNVLGLSLKRDADVRVDSFDKIICVDCTPKNTGIEAKYTHVIDHHLNEVDEEQFEFVKIEQVGSSCSLIYSLMQELGVEMSESDDVIATALLFGLKNDTHDLLSDNCTDIDYKAHAYFAKFADEQKLKSIIQYPIPRYLLELKSQVFKEEHYEFKDGAFVTFLGILSPAKRDAIAAIADEISRMEGVTTAITFAIIGECIETSVRSSNVSLDVDHFVKKIFGKENSGGKYGAAGARVPLNFFDISDQSEEVRDQFADLVKKMIMNRVMKEISSE